jgi:D-hydroxyproline dehydrogenase subunit beta
MSRGGRMTNQANLGHFDLAIVGAGIVGLAHALAGAKLGKKVVVIERDAYANGASIRNFGFITVTGQQAGQCYDRAMRSRNVWVEIAPKAGIEIVHNGLMVAARRSEAMHVLEAFARTEMGRDCALLNCAQAQQKMPVLQSDILGGLWSPHELRVESRTAIPKLSAWLEATYGITFLRSTLVKDVSLPTIHTTRGIVYAECAIVCAGHDFLGLFPERLAAYRLTSCKLQMLRVTPSNQRAKIGTAVMSDLGLVRYLGYAELPEAVALKKRLAYEQGDALENGVHLIVVQSSDGSLVVGDSHHYGETLDPFSSEQVDALIMNEFDRVLHMPGRTITERWVGTYASASDRLMLIDRPSDAVRLVVVTSGTGASTAFAIGEEVISDLFG